MTYEEKNASKLTIVGMILSELPRLKVMDKGKLLEA